MATTLYYLCGKKTTDISADDINKFIVDTFGFNDFIVSGINFPDKETVIRAGDSSYTGFSYATKIKSIKPLEDLKTEVIIDYYSDVANSSIARTVQYILTGMPYSNCVVDSRTVLFDSKEVLEISLL